MQSAKAVEDVALYAVQLFQVPADLGRLAGLECFGLLRPARCAASSPFPLFLRRATATALISVASCRIGLDGSTPSSAECRRLDHVSALMFDPTAQVCERGAERGDIVHNKNTSPSHNLGY